MYTIRFNMITTSDVIQYLQYKKSKASDLFNWIFLEGGDVVEELYRIFVSDNIYKRASLANSLPTKYSISKSNVKKVLEGKGYPIYLELVDGSIVAESLSPLEALACKILEEKHGDLPLHARLSLSTHHVICAQKILIK